MFLFKKESIAGLIKFYSLEEWWFSSFTKEERKYIDDKFTPMGSKPHILTQGNIKSSQSKVDFLAGLLSWFKSTDDSQLAQKIMDKLDEVAETEGVVKPGYYKGRHYSSFVPKINSLKRDGKYEELESLLYHLVEATEAESIETGYGVALFYYEELAILYRKQKYYSKEVAILERYMGNIKANGVKPAQLVRRLEKARELAGKGK